MLGEINFSVIMGHSDATCNSFVFHHLSPKEFLIETCISAKMITSLTYAREKTIIHSSVHTEIR